MKLYLVRHATASSKLSWDDDDDLRPLTRSGEARFATAAKALARASALSPEIIVTSPLVRAAQTAELLSAAVGGSVPIEHDDRLGHDFDLQRLGEIIAERSAVSELALVGHNPAFSAVLSAIIGGGSVEVRKGTIALVDIPDVSDPVGRLLWLAPTSLFAQAR